MEMLTILNRRTRNDGYDALDLLKQDHAAAAELFDHYDSMGDAEQKRDLVSQIIRMLTVHMRIEEALFYPTLRKAVGNGATLQEAEVGHATLKKLMADLNRSDADASHFDAKVKRLAHLVDHHAHEQEAQIFQEARERLGSGRARGTTRRIPIGARMPV
jgi:hemerythrin superfamily protein